MYEIFEKLMKAHGYTAYKVSVETGIAQSTLSDWKKGKYTPKQDKMQIIADFFGVSVNFLMGEEDRVYCEECEMYYNPLFEEEKVSHERHHRAYEEALEKYGKDNYLTNNECLYVENAMNSLYLGTFYNDEYGTTEAAFSLYKNYIKCCFSRKLRSVNFNVDYKNFEEYAREMVMASIHESFMTQALFDMLTKEYNIKPRILTKRKSKYYIDDETAKMAQSIFENKDLRMLFDAAQDAKPEDLQTVHTMLLALKRKERGDVD